MSIYIQLPEGFNVDLFKSIIEKMTRNQSGYERPLKEKASTTDSTLPIERKKKIIRQESYKQSLTPSSTEAFTPVIDNSDKITPMKKPFGTPPVI